MNGLFWFAVGVMVGAAGVFVLAVLHTAARQAGFPDEP